MQAYATLAAEPYPGSVKRFSWVLPQMSTLTIHLWPELNDILRQETVSRVHQVRLLALLIMPACPLIRPPACLLACPPACLPACLPA